jgi:Flp pilus assembly protein TadD
LAGLGLGSAYRAVSYDPSSASAQNTLGMLLDALGHANQASEAYKRARSLDPTAAWALNNLCYSAFRGGRFQEARSWCEEALKISPKLVAAHNNLALTFAADGDLVRARGEFLAAGDPAAAEFNLGIVYLAGQEYAFAADRFEQAIKARPNFGAAKTRAHEARMRALTGSN